MASSKAHSRHEARQRREFQEEIAKAVEIRAIHAALLRGGSNGPTDMRLLAGASTSLSRFSEEYPVFTPTYEEETWTGYRFIRPDGSPFDNWSGVSQEEEVSGSEPVSSCNKPLNKFSSDEQHYSSTRRSGLVEFKTPTTKDTRNPSPINKEADAEKKNARSFNSISPAVDTHITSHPPQSTTKGPILSCLFHRTKKKPKPNMSPTAVESEDMSQLSKDWGFFSLETLKKELVEANERRDLALTEVAEMRSSLGNLQQKLSTLESYSKELKKALKQAVQHKSTKSISSERSSNDSSMPVTHEAMIEGFLQIVSEARLSIKHFCKNLIDKIDGSELGMFQNSNQDNIYPKGVLYHLEALINQSLYQDFENCVFHPNGSPKALDPRLHRLENFSAFVALQHLSWKEVMGKGTKYYSEDFSKFCDRKMSDVVSMLNWLKPWPELLLQTFFVAAKCVWLLHLLAFSFDPPLVILRVNKDCCFDSMYMEDIQRERQKQAKTMAKVKIMVVPGFYVHDKVLRCRVLCRYA